ncbi:4-hydroxy-tetrahydrodipicolinate synthase [Desulfonema limicola]|uniref:4-hydroxy-tetrahydrodipicolinate synthase n=1 Tax=Desulfonema limicola TaxID=45656 RepID=A0A975B687_9BACT|nr:4-hydroxy-tetrahydrodipicolinate synthase [Desulfonema limicola]QTA79539.1 4-hydroxy-tetrahydrodipicolinate synthase [Desulfonema limicola]
MVKGTYTALITPLRNNAVDYEGLLKLADFQISNGISGLLAVGTTGESPVLTWNEHVDVIKCIAKQTKGKCKCIAGTGSNNTRESLDATKHAVNAGADAVLLVDPYYNGPSSLEIRKEYVSPIAREFSETQIIPYIIPGRTGAQLLPEDLALLSREFTNVSTVKEATGSLENMKRTRECCGPDFSILSGDDALTFEMMTSPQIQASGVISVASNIAPKWVSEMVSLLEQGEIEEAKKLETALTPLFNLVTVKTNEKTPYGDVVCRARNPLAFKTLMDILGMPSGGCRQPLGKLTKNGLKIVLEAARKVQAESPEIFKPVSDFFGIDIDEKLKESNDFDKFCYSAY